MYKDISRAVLPLTHVSHKTMRKSHFFKWLLLGGMLCASAYEVIPWPHGQAPSGEAFDGQVLDSLAREQLERFEEFLEAAEKGEDREHITVFQDLIDSGAYDVDTLFAFGDALFEHEFSLIDGLGTGELGINRVHNGQTGGLDTFSCASCHSLGGADGAGTFQQNAFLYGDGASISSALARNAPSLLGIGLIQSLAAEMTLDLQSQKYRATELARTSGQAVNQPLFTKGVDFGAITVLPTGEILTDAVEGIDADLVVRPFGWKGEFATLRAFLEDAARVHFGVQSHGLALVHQDTPMPEKLGMGDWWDPDTDGIQRELETGTITAGAVYLALLESPIILPPYDEQLRDIWAQGSEIFDRIECSSCHIRSLTLTRSKWVEGPDSALGAGFEFSIFRDGEFPKSVPHVELFSDLKRHDLGEELADPFRNPHDIEPALFRTPPLWGLADTAPYLHDGRAFTVTDAIEAHGGDASHSRELFRTLPENEKAALRVFLASLTREPKLRVSR